MYLSYKEGIKVKGYLHFHYKFENEGTVYSSTTVLLTHLNTAERSVTPWRFVVYAKSALLHVC